MSRILETGFGLVIGFIEQLQIVNISNYSAIANSHTLQFTTAHTEFSQFVFTSSFLLIDAKNVFCLRPYRRSVVQSVL
jgi:hypothetical protein